MPHEERLLLEQVRQARDAVAKARVPVPVRSALQKAVDVAIADAQLLVALRERLLGDVAAHRAQPGTSAGRSRQLADALKALRARHAALRPHHQETLRAIADAGGASDPALARVLQYLRDLGLCLLDFSAFEEVQAR